MKADIRWLDDPKVFREGTLPACSDHAFFESRAACRARFGAEPERKLEILFLRERGGTADGVLPGRF